MLRGYPQRSLFTHDLHWKRVEELIGENEQGNFGVQSSPQHIIRYDGKHTVPAVPWLVTRKQRNFSASNKLAEGLAQLSPQHGRLFQQRIMQRIGEAREFPF